MKIVFLEDIKYCEDAFTVMQGHKGEARDVSHSIACALLRQGKAYNAENETGDERLDKVMNDIVSITCKRQEADKELYACIDQLNALLRPDGSATIMNIPNKAMRDFSAGREAREAMEE